MESRIYDILKNPFEYYFREALKELKLLQELKEKERQLHIEFQDYISRVREDLRPLAHKLYEDKFRDLKREKAWARKRLFDILKLLYDVCELRKNGLCNEKCVFYKYCLEMVKKHERGKTYGVRAKNR